MPALKNRKHERFCLQLVKLHDETKAYKRAYPNSKSKAACRANAARLMQNDTVSARLAELRGEVAKQVVAEAVIDEVKLVKELERVAFSDMRTIASWGGKKVTLKSSEEIGAAAAAAVQSIRQGAKGEITLTLHPKIEAVKVLVAISERQKAALNPNPQANPLNLNLNIGIGVKLIDAPPDETYEQWMKRRGRQLQIEDKAKKTA